MKKKEFESIQIAEELFKNGNFDDAIRLIREDPEIESRQKEEILFESYAEHAPAEVKIEYFEQHVRPDSLAFYISLGKAYFQSGKYENAVDTIQKGLVLDSGSYKLWFHLGRSFEASGKHEEAIRSYNESLRRQEDVRTLFFLAKLHARLGDIGKARKLYNEILDKNPHYSAAVAGKQICEVYIEKEKVDEKENLLNRISNEKYSKEFAYALLISLSLIANADHQLLASELDYIHLRLKYFKKFLPLELDAWIEKEYTLSFFEIYIRNIPSLGRLFLFQLLCEIASIDDFLASQEYILLMKFQNVLNINPSLARTVIQKTKPANWQSLTCDVNLLKRSCTEGNCELFVYNWGRYWNSAWTGVVPETREILEAYRRVKECVLTVETHSGKRFVLSCKPERLDELRKIGKDYPADIVPDNSLCPEGFEKTLLSKRKELRSETFDRIVEILLINKVFQAFQVFFRCWEKKNLERSLSLTEHDVIINKVSLILENWSKPL